jgi:Fanconi anemia group J protein
VHKIKGHPSLQKGGCHEAHDIEDLVKVGQVVKGLHYFFFPTPYVMVLQTQSYNNFLPSLGCSYYAARSMADDAQLVFCPYNYIINPVIRGAMEVDIKGAIVILDEAQYFSPPHLIKFNFL